MASERKNAMILLVFASWYAFAMATLLYYFGVDDMPLFYVFNAKTIDGGAVHLEKSIGKVSFVTNIATNDPRTEAQMKALVKLQETFGPTGKFNVISFSCKDLGEELSDEQIEKWAKEKYHVNFPMMARVYCTTSDGDFAFRNLVDQTEIEPTGNFYKYLVNYEGRVTKVWKPDDPVEDAIEDIKKAIDVANNPPSEEERAAEAKKRQLEREQSEKRRQEKEREKPSKEKPTDKPAKPSKSKDL